MTIKKILFPIIMLLFISSGCSDKTLKFNELYDGNPSKLEMITIIDSSTGHIKKITTKEDISSLLDELNNATYTITDTDKEEINGVLYGVTFYESNHAKPVFSMTTNVVNEKVFESDKDLESIFKKYYDKGHEDNEKEK